MKEIKSSEMAEPKEVSFREIKPKTSLTAKEATNYWDKKFSEETSDKMETDSKKESIKKTNVESNGEFPKQVWEDGHNNYYDDNGKLYRTDKELNSSCEYTINGYDYKTDDQGRIIEASGKLHLKDHSGHKNIKESIQDIGKGDEKKTDDRGHLIGDQFGGKNGLENAIPQDSEINQKDYRNLEDNLAKHVRNGDDVKVKVKPIYESNSHRPKAICVSYSINGERSIQIFPNGKG